MRHVATVPVLENIGGPSRSCLLPVRRFIVYYVLICFVIYCIHTFPDSKLYDFVTSKQTPGKFMHVEKMRGSV